VWSPWAVSGLDGVLLRLVRPRRHHEQPLRRLAYFHAARAFPPTRVEVCVELTADSQLALDLAEPAGETRGIGEC
jgi:hypothetical protein